MNSGLTGRKIVVFDIDQIDLELLERFGVISNNDPSWTPGRRNKEGLLLLLSQCGMSDDGEVVEISHRANRRIDSAEEYFTTLADQIADQISKAANIIIINLMSLVVCKTRMDKILKGLFDGSGESRTCDFLLLSRNIDGVEHSSGFKTIQQRTKTGSKITIVDIRGYATRYVGGQTAEPFRIDDRSAFRAVLSCSEEVIYRALIFETNSFIGHFVLPNSHARTHYSLDDFVDRDDVWEYLIHFFHQQIGGAENVIIAGVGMESGVISKIGERLKLLLGDKCVFKVEPFTEMSEAFQGWSSRFQAAIIVTDIVNSGGSLRPAVNLFKSENRHERPLRILSIAAMENSPKEIEGVQLVTSLKIRRKYYSTDPNVCPLCRINQPKILVTKVEDFENVHREQLTPFDFWELVQDSNALQESKTDVQGRPFFFRIETSLLMKRYGSWLRNLVRVRFRESWPRLKPDAICTVNEVGGREFAKLVASAIGVSNVIQVPRAELIRATPAGRITDPRVERGDKILLVDDGMNYGSTMKQLITYNLSCGANLLGAIVLDNRLRDDDLNMITRSLDNRVLPLYSWPATSITR